MRNLRRIRSIQPDGTAFLEDGTEMQLVVSETGSLGVRPKVMDDRMMALDQYPTDQTPQSTANHFDTSGLDQPV